MSELEERPPVPEADEGGNVRIGWTAAGVLFLLGGLGGLVLGNLLAHRLAPAAGVRYGPWWVGPALGPYAWAILALGLIMGVLGAVLLWLAHRSPRGRFVLPGYPY
ncbi:MAG: hypothetical protein L3K04_07750 [Thermoplasmata archaeon]|nr:hypothetical protein [Thermoplasmata archaeon]MCI4341787.1 hypothetical protein [Thermoplasmata archaeon]